MTNMREIEFVIPVGIDDMRIDKAVALETHLSRSTIANMFENDLVLCNGKNVKRSEKIFAGDVISVTFPDENDEKVQGQDIELNIVYEDDHIVVINKEPHMVVHPGAGNKDGTIANALVYKYSDISEVGESHRPGIVHRLDVGTSGLLVAVKTNEAYEKFVEMFSTHDVERDYLALVWGRMETSEGIIDAPIGRSPNRATQMAVVETGKPARTHYKVRDHYPEKNVTLLDISLETGRTHQIRVHCSAIDHPIVGDKTYGGYRQNLEVPRPFLHAHTLRFDHPVTNEKMTFSAGLPEDLLSVLNALEATD